MTGYSGTPLWKKLGITEGCQLFATDIPPNYMELLAEMPKGTQFASRIDANTDIVHLFVTERSTLARSLKAARRKIRDDAVVWVSWPKKTAKIATDITEDIIREIALPLDFVDIKVCAVDESWSGLKLVIRKDRRGSKP